MHLTYEGSIYLMPTTRGMRIGNLLATSMILQGLPALKATALDLGTNQSTSNRS